MKRAACLLAVCLAGAGSAGAGEVQLSLAAGYRTVNDQGIKDSYGGGGVYSPAVAVGLWEGLVVGASYEGGYERDAELGLFAEPATLRVTGVELFAGYEYRRYRLRPYLRLGLASFGYEQTIDSLVVGDIAVDDRQTTVTVAAGARVPIHKGLFAAVDAQYVPLRVRPLDEEVDLGGWRLKLAVGYSFAF